MLEKMFASQTMALRQTELVCSTAACKSIIRHADALIADGREKLKNGEWDAETSKTYHSAMHADLEKLKNALMDSATEPTSLIRPSQSSGAHLMLARQSSINQCQLCDTVEKQVLLICALYAPMFKVQAAICIIVAVEQYSKCIETYCEDAPPNTCDPEDPACIPDLL